MNINDIKQSKYLKKEDCGDGILVTVSGLTQENVAKEGAEPEMKVCIHFHEVEKPMVLNSTNAQIIAKITGHDEDIENTWVGAKLVLYNDPNISFAGKITGGIRVRAPRNQAAEKPLPF
jgi:hypothetical protein